LKPDLIVGDIPDIHNWGTLNNVAAYSIATTSCNIGQANLDWVPAPNPNHPVIAQNLYRVSPQGRIVQIGGLTWLKHGFAVAASNVCGNCQDNASNHLAPNCSDLYSAFLNGQQSNLGPRSDVNAATGAYGHPVFPKLPNPVTILDGRMQVKLSDINPTLNPGARYLTEGEYVYPQDAAAGKGANNASTREAFVTMTNGQPVLGFHPQTLVKRQVPAVQAWAGMGPGTVKLIDIDVPNDGRMILGVRGHHTAAGFHYEIALQNINSDRSARSLTATAAGGTLSNFTFSAPTYVHGPYSSAPWAEQVSGSSVTWSTQTFAANKNANALRWATLCSFSLDSQRPIQTISVGLFKPGDPTTMGPFPIPTPAAAPLASVVSESQQAAGPESWLVAPESVELKVGPDAAAFNVFLTPGAPRKVFKVVSSSPDLTVRHEPVRDGDHQGFAVRVEKAPDAKPGYFESVLTLESDTGNDPPVKVRAFGEIASSETK
jgi:hypothetical protein